MKQVRDHRKKQKVQEVPAAADGATQVAAGTGTTLAMHSSESVSIFGREIPAENNALFRGCVKKALEDPLPVSRLAAFPEMNLRDQRDLLFQCKQRVPLLYPPFFCVVFFVLVCLPLVVSVLQLAYEELALDRRVWNEWQTLGGQVANLQDGYDTMFGQKERAVAALDGIKAELERTKAEAGRLVQEAEDKAKAAVAAESARLQVEFDRRLEVALGEAKKEAILAYRRDRGRAVEQATAYIDGGVYILGKIKEAFPEQDWSQLPVPELTDDHVDDEHRGILQEIEDELAGAPSQSEPQSQQQPEE